MVVEEDMEVMVVHIEVAEEDMAKEQMEEVIMVVAEDIMPQEEIIMEEEVL
jgi:hypothetical protein